MDQLGAAIEIYTPIGKEWDWGFDLDRGTGWRHMVPISWDWHEVQADWIDRQPPSVIDVHDSPSGFPWGDQGVEPLAFYGQTTARDAFPFHGLPIPTYLHLVTLELMTPILPRP
jgi:hypothetical protein